MHRSWRGTFSFAPLSYQRPKKQNRFVAITSIPKRVMHLPPSPVGKRENITSKWRTGEEQLTFCRRKWVCFVLDLSIFLSDALSVHELWRKSWIVGGHLDISLCRSHVIRSLWIHENRRPISTSFKHDRDSEFEQTKSLQNRHTYSTQVERRYSCTRAISSGWNKKPLFAEVEESWMLVINLCWAFHVLSSIVVTRFCNNVPERHRS